MHNAHSTALSRRTQCLISHGNCIWPRAAFILCIRNNRNAENREYYSRNSFRRSTSFNYETTATPACIQDPQWFDAKSRTHSPEIKANKYDFVVRVCDCEYVCGAPLTLMTARPQNVITRRNLWRLRALGVSGWFFFFVPSGCVCVCAELRSCWCELSRTMSESFERSRASLLTNEITN